MIQQTRTCLYYFCNTSNQTTQHTKSNISDYLQLNLNKITLISRYKNKSQSKPKLRSRKMKMKKTFRLLFSFLKRRLYISATASSEPFNSNPTDTTEDTWVAWHGGKPVTRCWMVRANCNSYWALVYLQAQSRNESMNPTNLHLIHETHLSFCPHHISGIPSLIFLTKT